MGLIVNELGQVAAFIIPLCMCACMLFGHHGKEAQQRTKCNL